MQFDKNKALSLAEKKAKEFDPEEAEAFIKKHTDKEWYSDFILLYDMVTDKNFKLSTSVYLSIAGALAYVVFPIDVIPDFIPVAGFIDDAFVVGMVMKSISNEIERFKAYKGEM